MQASLDEASSLADFLEHLPWSPDSNIDKQMKLRTLSLLSEAQSMNVSQKSTLNRAEVDKSPLNKVEVDRIPLSPNRIQLLALRKEIDKLKKESDDLVTHQNSLLSHRNQIEEDISLTRNPEYLRLRAAATSMPWEEVVESLGKKDWMPVSPISPKPVVVKRAPPRRGSKKFHVSQAEYTSIQVENNMDSKSIHDTEPAQVSRPVPDPESSIEPLTAEMGPLRVDVSSLSQRVSELSSAGYQSPFVTSSMYHPPTSKPPSPPVQEIAAQLPLPLPRSIYDTESISSSNMSSAPSTNASLMRKPQNVITDFMTAFADVSSPPENVDDNPIIVGSVVSIRHAMSDLKTDNEVNGIKETDDWEITMPAARRNNLRIRTMASQAMSIQTTRDSQRASLGSNKVMKSIMYKLGKNGRYQPATILFDGYAIECRSETNRFKWKIPIEDMKCLGFSEKEQLAFEIIVNVKQSDRQYGVKAKNLAEFKRWTDTISTEIARKRTGYL